MNRDYVEIFVLLAFGLILVFMVSKGLELVIKSSQARQGIERHVLQRHGLDMKIKIVR